MYAKNAELFHRPRVRIVESSIPALAAVVAAPIRKLCPAKLLYGRSAASKAVLTCCVNFALHNGFPPLNLKNGPGVAPRIAIYASMAVTGHNLQPVLPTNTSTPFPN